MPVALQHPRWWRRIAMAAVVPLALLFASCASPGQAGPAQPPLRVMTFNVRLLTDADGANRWQARRDMAARMVREAAPDVFGTQELFKQQGDDLVARLPEYAWFGKGRHGDDSDEHMGVFYRKDRLRVVESGNFWLSDTPDVAGSISWGNLFPRMVTWAKFARLRGGAEFYLFNTHLPYREQDEAARERGAKMIAARIAALPKGVPVVLTGDFNTVPDSATHAALDATLHDAWQTAPQRSGPEATFHNFTGKPDRRIDWIFVRGFDVRSVRTIDMHQNGRYPSDHFPVLAELEFSP